MTVEAKVRWESSCQLGVDQSERLAVVIAAVSEEELENALITEIARSEPLAVEAVDLRVSQDSGSTLEIHDHEIAFRGLVAVVREGLGNERAFAAAVAGPAGIVVELLVDTLNEVLGVEHFLELWHLHQEGMHEGQQQSRVRDIFDHRRVEGVDQVLTDVDQLQVTAHLIYGIVLMTLVFFDNQLLVQLQVVGIKGVTHTSFREWQPCQLQAALDLAVLQERLAPIDGHSLVLDDEVSVLHYIEDVRLLQIAPVGLSLELLRVVGALFLHFDSLVNGQRRQFA